MNIASISSLTSLVSMRSSVSHASTIKSSQNELEEEANIYRPSVAYKGDLKTANALTSKAENLNGSIGQIITGIQNNLRNTADSTGKASSSPTDSKTDAADNAPNAATDSQTQDVQSSDTLQKSVVPDTDSTKHHLNTLA